MYFSLTLNLVKLFLILLEKHYFEQHHIIFQLTDDPSQLITFSKIDATAIIADGVTQPAVVTVTGSDGKVRKLIFKVI